MDIDFKHKAAFMTDEELCNAYENITPMRQTDMTPKTMEFVLENLIGNSILEIGCGNGDMSIACAEKGYKVFATDLAQGNLNQLEKKIINKNLDIITKIENAEKLSFEDHSFDTTICLHTLEHIRNLYEAIKELKRVTRKRLIIIVPKERYHRYACNYHLNFFGDPEQLILTMQNKKAQCYVIDNDLCYVEDIVL